MGMWCVGFGLSVAGLVMVCWCRWLVMVCWCGWVGDGERVRHRLWGTCNNRTIVPRKEIQWHNGTPQEKF